MGATERAALDRLVRDFGAEVKVQYDAQRTRLHAKAWLFRRNTGFDTAYVGSQQPLPRRAARRRRVERAPLRGGHPGAAAEVRRHVRHLLERPDVRALRPGHATATDSTTRCAEATRHETHDRVTLTLSGLEVRPYPHQQEMLDAARGRARVHDRHRNLVVAATGTGKTVVAALDYRRLCRAGAATVPRLLFVAHRREILEQSLRTYREVLADARLRRALRRRRAPGALAARVRLASSR